MNDVPELQRAQTYPAMDLLRRHGDTLALMAGAGTFAAVLTGGRPSISRVLRALLMGGAAGFGVRYMRELNDVISDTLLPQ